MPRTLAPDPAVGRPSVLPRGNAWAAGGARAFTNALTRAACSLGGGVARALEEAKALSPLGSGMSGSGSACYAVFASEADCLAARERYTGNAAALCVRTVPQR